MLYVIGAMNLADLEEKPPIEVFGSGDRGSPLCVRMG